MPFPPRNAPKASHSAPPFRPKKRVPGAPGGMAGGDAMPMPAAAPMQRGPSAPSAFGSGRGPRPPFQSMRTPQAGAPMMRPKGMPMMADGGFGSPTPFGGDAEPDQDDTQTPQTPPAGGAPLPMIKPESVNYHDNLQQCSGCQYMQEDGSCQVLQMQVSPEGGCNSFEAKAADQGDQPAMGAPDNSAPPDSGDDSY